MNKQTKHLLVILALGLALMVMPAQFILAAAPASQQGQVSGHSPEDLIKAVNDLRLENGLPIPCRPPGADAGRPMGG